MPGANTEITCGAISVPFVPCTDTCKRCSLLVTTENAPTSNVNTYACPGAVEIVQEDLDRVLDSAYARLGQSRSDGSAGAPVDGSVDWSADASRLVGIARSARLSRHGRSR